MIVSVFDLQLLARTLGYNLRSLEIHGCKMISEDGLVYIARYCKYLRSLHLDGNDIDRDANGKWLHELALCNTVMKSLYFQDPFDTYDMKDVTLLANKCSKSLASLHIYPRSLSEFREELHEDQFPFLHHYLNQLWELDLKCGVIDQICQRVLFQNCPSLVVLHTQDICGDGGLQNIGQFCKKLGKLNYDGWVTQTGLIALAQGCPHLVCIKVYLLDISNEALECVGTHLKNLHEPCIVLGEEEGITMLDNEVQDMQMGCRKLEKLDMNLFPYGLTDVGLGYIGEDKGDAGYHGVLIHPMVFDEASLYLFTMEPPLGLVT
nr:hypothetical protein [Tanacetum cinerariifolium]